MLYNKASDEKIKLEIVFTSLDIYSVFQVIPEP